MQKELRLTPEQRVAVIDRLADLRDDHERELQRLRRDIPDPEDAAVQRAVRRHAAALEDACRDVIAARFTAAQRDRLRQVGWQVAGPEAFRDPVVVRALRLTDAQTKAVDAALTPFRTTAARFRDGAIDGDPSKGVDELLKDRAAAAREIEAALTPDQRAAWRAVAGEPAKGVDVTALFLESAGR